MYCLKILPLGVLFLYVDEKTYDQELVELAHFLVTVLCTVIC
jgi:hypothetical protein